MNKRVNLLLKLLRSGGSRRTIATIRPCCSSNSSSASACCPARFRWCETVWRSAAKLSWFIYNYYLLFVVCFMCFKFEKFFGQANEIWLGHGVPPPHRLLFKIEIGWGGVQPHPIKFQLKSNGAGRKPTPIKFQFHCFVSHLLCILYVLHVFVFCMFL